MSQMFGQFDSITFSISGTCGEGRLSYLSVINAGWFTLHTFQKMHEDFGKEGYKQDS